MAKSRYTTIHQHPPLRTPPGWGSQEKQLIAQLEELFDDVYRRFGRLRLQDLGDPLAQTITDTSAGVDQAARDIVDVGESVAYLERDLTVVTEDVTVIAKNMEFKADRIELDAYVKITDLEADVLEVMESANIYSLTVTTLNAFSINCNDGSVNALNLFVEYAEVGGEVVATEDWVESQLEGIRSRLATLEGT